MNAIAEKTVIFVSYFVDVSCLHERKQFLLFTYRLRERFSKYVFFAAFFVLTCLSLFTSLSFNSITAAAWGYSFGLGWAAFPVTLIAGLTMTALELHTSTT